MKKKTHSKDSRQTLWLRYLKGELPDNESYELEKKIATDKDAQLALSAIAQNELSQTELDGDLADIRQRWNNRTSTKNRVINPRIRQMAAVFFLGFGIWASIQYYQDQQGSTLYADYFEADTYLTVRGESTATPAFKNAMKAYKAKAYESSLVQFQYLSEQTQEDEQTYLYAALSAMQLGQNFEAKELLTQIKNLNIEASDKASAYWYLALIYLKENKNTTCKKELDWLLENTPNGQWGSNAAKLYPAIK